MARIFITGSSTGLGLIAAQLLISQGHTLVLHGRDQARGRAALAEAAGADAVVVGDLETLAGMRAVIALALGTDVDSQVLMLK